MDGVKRTLNLSPINYWTEQPFLDRGLAAGGDLAHSPPYTLTPMDSAGAVFEVLWDGGGTLSVGPGATVHSSVSGRIVLTWIGPAAMLQLTPRGVGQSNIRVVRQDQLAAYQAGGFWRPDFLDDLKGFSAFRVMDWMQTNGSTRTDVLLDGDRPVIEAAGRGTMPLSLIIDLANRTGMRPWINLPHLITDDAARAVLASLKACKPRPIVEYSNEMWNWGFAQTKWAMAQAPASHAGDNNYFYGYRAGQLARIARGSGVDFVLCEQMATPARMTPVLAGLADAGAMDSDFAAVAPATYISGDLVDYGEFPTLALDLMAKGDVAGAHDNMMTALPAVRALYAAWATLAKAHGWKLWAYEGGNFHLNARQASRDQDKLRQFFQAVQLAPRAVDTMRAYSQAWAAAGGDMDALFNFGSGSTIDGFFGLKLQPLLWAWVKADMALPPVEEASAPDEAVEPALTIAELSDLADRLASGLAKLASR